MISFEEIKSYMMALPETSEVAHWGKLSYRINNKIFAVLQEDGITLTVKTVGDDRSIYTVMNANVYRIPETFSKLNYMHVSLEHAELEELQGLLCKAWGSVAPKKLIKQLNAL